MATQESVVLHNGLHSAINRAMWDLLPRSLILDGNLPEGISLSEEFWSNFKLYVVNCVLDQIRADTPLVEKYLDANRDLDADRFQRIRELLREEIAAQASGDVNMERMDLCMFLLEKIGDQVQVPDEDAPLEYEPDGDRQRLRMQRHGPNRTPGAYVARGAIDGTFENVIRAGQEWNRNLIDIVRYVAEEISSRWRKPEDRARTYLDLHEKFANANPEAAAKALQMAARIIEQESEKGQDDEVFPDVVLGGPHGGEGSGGGLYRRDGEADDRGDGGPEEGPQEVQGA